MIAYLNGNRKARIALAVLAAAAAAAGAFYLYHHDPYSYPLPCAFYLVTGFYCPGCGSGRACFCILHGELVEAFCYNPLMTVLLPLIGIYIAVRGVDWVWTGKNHVDKRVSIRMLVAVLIVIMLYGILRNIPAYPFRLLAPGGLSEVIGSV